MRTDYCFPRVWSLGLLWSSGTALLATGRGRGTAPPETTLTICHSTVTAVSVCRTLQGSVRKVRAGSSVGPVATGKGVMVLN